MTDDKLNYDEAERAREWEAGWTPGRITVDECATVVDAEYRSDYRWNGWLCPRMSRDAAEQVLRALAEDAPDSYIVMLDGDDFILYEPEQALKYEFGTDANGRWLATPVGPDPDYEPEIVSPTEAGWYSPGYMGWCWELAWDEGEEGESS